jgi:hypothetical protein
MTVNIWSDSMTIQNYGLVQIHANKNGLIHFQRGSDVACSNIKTKLTVNTVWTVH